MAGRSTAAMRAARRGLIPHRRSEWCECLACHAGQLALRLPPTYPVAQPVNVVPADRLLRGPGERRVCERDSECLDEWVRGPTPDDEAHCPPACPRFQPVDRRHYWVSAHSARHYDTDADLPTNDGDD